MTGGGEDAKDKTQRAQGKKTALAKQESIARTQQRELEQACTTLQTKPPPLHLMDTLKQVLRNTQEWTKRLQLYQAAIQICGELSHYHPQTMGTLDQEDSILMALSEFTQTCRLFLNHTPKVATFDQSLVDMAKRVLEVFDQANQASQRSSPQSDLIVADAAEHYRHSMKAFAFDVCEALQGHSFANHPTVSKKSSSSSSSSNHQNYNSKELWKEVTTYPTALPIEYGSSVLVRAVEGQINVLRALIFGPDDTPYANGCFVFDILLQQYPKQPPKVKFVTTGGGKYRMNPNLYEDGKVCLSLLGTWSGPAWQPGESTLLQVLVSIQSLILVPDPYFNEPGWECQRGTENGKKLSQDYNNKIREYTLRAAIFPFLESGGPYPEFQAAVVTHFKLKRHYLQQQLAQWAVQQPTQIQPLLDQCTEIWLKQSEQPNRKRKSVCLLPVEGVRQVNGVFEIDLDDDDDQDQKKESAAVSKRPFNAPKTRTDRDRDNIIEILDDNRKLPAISHPTSAIATRTKVSTPKDVVDLT